MKQAKDADPYAGGTVCLVVHTFEILILPVLAFYDGCHFKGGRRGSDVVATEHFSMVSGPNVTRNPFYYGLSVPLKLGIFSDWR